MAVTIQIGVERLNDPSVAKALANLVLALGGAATGQKKPADPPAPKAEPVAAPTPVAAPAPAAAAPAAPAPKKARKSRKAAPAKAAAPAAKKASAPASDADAGDAAARYEAFVANLPDRSRAFLDLLRQRGTLTINDAMDALDISVPKAMGGITGSIGRWAPVRGVPVPYTASMVDGVRTWTWVGGPDGASPAPAAKPAAKKAKPAKKGKAAAKKAKPAAKKSKAAKKSAAAAKADDASPAQRYRDFVNNLPDRSQKFLDLVSERGLLTISDAMAALGLTVPKAMGGITGSIGRWAPVRGIKVPYQAITVDGERAWKWLGAPTDDAEGTSPKAEAPAGVTPEASSAPKGANSADEGDDSKAAVEAIIAALPERASLFVRTLRQRELMTMQEVLDTFSLAKARAVSGIVDPIFTAFREAGLPTPFEATFAPTGEKAWVWSKPAVQEAAATPVEQSDASDERGISSARPGVRVRRRAR